MLQAIVFYFWVVVVFLEGRTGRMISWQFVVLEDDGQDTRLFVVKTLSTRLKNEAEERLRVLASYQSAQRRLSA